MAHCPPGIRAEVFVRTRRALALRLRHLQSAGARPLDTQKPKRSAIGWCFFILAGLSALTGLTAALVTIVLGQAALCRVGGPVLEATGWQDGLTHCAEVIAADGKTEQMLAEQAKLIVQMSAKLDELANKDKPQGETTAPPTEQTERRDEAVADLAQDPAPEAQDAAQAIAAGDIERATRLLKEQAAAATTTAIHKWRRLGELLYDIDTAAALEGYRKALELGSEEPWDTIYLGRLYVQAGDLGKARAAFETALDPAVAKAKADPEALEPTHDWATLHEALGEIHKALGDLPESERHYQQRLSLTSGLASRFPDNTHQQRDLSVSHNKIGDVQRDQGNLPGALESYRASHAIFEKLAVRDPGNAGWRDDLSISYEKIGDVRRSQGDLAGALESYLAGHNIARKLTAQDPGNAKWQRELAVLTWRLALIDGGGVTWHQVADAWQAMEDRGILFLPEKRWLKEAKQRAAAEAAQ